MDPIISTLKLGARQGGRKLENNYPKTQRWLQTESWICNIWKFVSSHHIRIYHLEIDVSTKSMQDSYLISHLALNFDFTTSELQAIKFRRMSKGIFPISYICKHQGTHLHKSAANTDITFNLIHNSNWSS